MVSPGPAARLASVTAGLRVILGRRCGALNDRAPSCGEGQEAFEQHAREDHPGGHGHSNWSIALRGPIARASRTSRVAAPSSATRGSGESARAGSEFFVNRHRRMNGTRFRDISLELYEIGMSYDSVGDIDGEGVAGVACAALCHEDEIPGAIVSRMRVCHRC